ncbi:MAG: pyruvate kinase [Syntrophales bacterium]|nr:pyruvate kinase [Syntrophales bacterium]
MRKTKIVCTIGPASSTAQVIEAMIKGGMDVARLNFSHGTHEDHREKIMLIRSISQRLNQPVAILQDLAGPKIRVGPIPEPGVMLKSNQTFTLTTLDIQGTDEQVSISYRRLPKEVKVGDRILLADGLMELQVVKTGAGGIHCRVITGGLLTSNKGINLPSGTIRTPAMTNKDREDLRFGLAHDVDYVALSFVRSAEDIASAQTIIRRANKKTPVIAKIEKHEALQHIDAILEVSGGLMVARGDLGVEIPLEDVPLIQKQLIRQANAVGKPVITATQMLRSMVASPRPTRAEAADVANAVLDGTDAVMLSEETASGAYPVEAVRFMDRLARIAETGYAYASFLRQPPRKHISESVAHASCVLADHLDARAIVVHTRSGATAGHISRFRPRQPIIALSPDKETIRRLTLIWGCQPFLIDEAKDTDAIFETAPVFMLKAAGLKVGDLIVMTLGHPLYETGTTNMIRVRQL